MSEGVLPLNTRSKLNTSPEAAGNTTLDGVTVMAAHTGTAPAIQPRTTAKVVNLITFIIILLHINQFIR
jgi:hypothetical protein